MTSSVVRWIGSVFDVGVDTVKLSYPMGSGSRFNSLLSQCSDVQTGAREYRFGEFRSRPLDCGSTGAVQWRVWRHPELRAAIVEKGVPGSSATLVYEGSVPKELGVSGAAPGGCVEILDTELRRLFRESGLRYLQRGVVRRCDLTHDEPDPERDLLKAALGWMPHPRSRYVQSVHDDRSSQGHTVFQHNKTRGVRVYDKFHECGEEWARDLTRVEYQVRGAWLEKYGIALGCDWDRLEGRVLAPLVADLKERVS